MRRDWIGILGVVLVLGGIVGFAAVSMLVATVPVPPTGVGLGRQLPGTPTTNGERIYLTGVGHTGPIPRTGGSMMLVACVDCHGRDGRGGRVTVMMGTAIDVPDIRYSTLTSPRTDNGTTAPGWSDAQVATAIRQGVEPSGKQMNTFMPRWEMDDADMSDVMAYLKVLDRR